MPEVTLEFIARQSEKIIEEQARQREDMAVLLAIVQRMDGTLQGLINEVRAEHSRHTRLERRVAKLEEA